MTAPSISSTLDFRPASAADVPALRALLDACGLPAADLDLAHQAFVLAFGGPVLVGSVGLEDCGDARLLRSLAVAAPLRGQGLGDALYRRALAAVGPRPLYLLTTTAEAFFARRGFRRIPRSDLPAAVAATPEAASLCPASAICMRLDPDPGRPPG